MIKRNTVAIFGIPIDHLQVSDVISKALDFMAHSESINTPKYIGTVNVDFIVNTHHWHSSFIRYPELLNALRRSDLITADGMPIVWLSKWLGTPLKERITGADLVPALLKALAQHKKSIFLLGGQPETTQKAAEKIKEQYPSIHIAGIATPFVPTQGEELENADLIDAKIIEAIHHSSPDLLLIALGNPKQEIWFQRIRRKLHTPLSIGVGGVFQFMAGTISRSPSWMQNRGLEWLHRLLQEPKRLGKRYALDILKFAYMVTPLLIYHLFCKGVEKMDKRSSSLQLLFFINSTPLSFAIIELPSSLTSQHAENLASYLEDAFKQDIVLINFHHTKFVDPTILGLLILTWLQALQTNKKLLGFGISPRLQRLLRLHRCWDVFSSSLSHTFQDALDRLALESEQSILCETVQRDPERITIVFFGYLDASQNFGRFYEKMIALIENRQCTLDLSYCPFIDSSGLSFLLKLRKYSLTHHHLFILKGLSADTRQALRIANIESLFTINP